MYKLIATDGERTYSFEIAPGEYSVGRSREADITVPNKTMSRNHARLEVGADGRMSLTDSGSHNGTFVNGSTVTATVDVKPGDDIIFGQVECQLLREGEDPVQRPASTQTILSAIDPERSVVMSVNEALKPLPAKVTELPELLPTLFEMAKALTVDEPQSEMFHRSLRLISRVLPSDRLAILLRDDSAETSDQVYAAAVYAPGGRDSGAFHISRAIVESIFSEQNAILIGNTKDDPRFAKRESIIMSEISSAIAAPLFDEGKALGILYLDTRNPFHSYSNEHLRLVTTFGNIIAARMLNYALLQERQLKQAMEAEMARAESIQRGLLLRTLPEAEGCEFHAFQEPSRQVGGDLYDLTQLPDGRTLFLVADVSGKGMGAALLMTNILASFRTLYRSPDFKLLDAVTEISRQLFASSSPTDFATLFAGIIDTKNNTLSYVNAGHNPPLLTRASGRLEELPASGVMIGAFDFAAWQEDTVEFHPGDLLCVFTDGVTEAENDALELFGEERLEAILRSSDGVGARDCCDRVLSAVSEFVGKAPQSDDITIMTLKRTG